MPGERLREYDLDLCAYVLAQFRPALGRTGRRQVTAPRLHPDEWDRLDFTTFVGRRVACLPVPLADLLWAGGPPDHPLTDADLYSLADAATDPPLRLDGQWTWSPAPALHRRAVECVPEIRSAVTRQAAEEWAADAAAAAAQLTSPSLPVAAGIAAVHEWLWCLRRLRGVIEAGQRPEGREGASVRGLAVAATPTRGLEGYTNGDQVGASKSGVCGWREAMAVTGLKKTKLYDLFRRGAVRGYRDGAMVRFYRASLHAFMRERENAPAAPTTAPAPQKPRRPRPTAPGLRFKFLTGCG